MPDTTARLFIPHPSDDDAVAYTDVALETMADYIDDMIPSVKGRKGRYTATTSGAGVINIPHGMGGVPDVAFASALNSSIWAVFIGTPTSTLIPVTVRNITTGGSTVNSTSVTVMWEAWL